MIRDDHPYTDLMKAIFILMIALCFCKLASAQMEIITEERHIEGIDRLITVKDGLYKQKLSQRVEALHPDVAKPILALTEYGLCSNTGKAPDRRSYQYEQSYIASYFRCTKKIDPVEWKLKKIKPLCQKGKILSAAQEVLCKELGLKLN